MNGFSLEGRTAFVNGGARGIGGATSIALATLGAAVAIADIRGDEAKETARAITEQGGRAIALEGDGAVYSNVRAMALLAKQELGPISIGVNIVGGAVARDSFFEEDDEDWDLQLRVNLKSHFYLVRAVAPDMKEQRYGKIVCLSADSGRTGGGLINRSCYSAAKAGVIAFVKSIARELGPYGVTVNSVSPGPTGSPEADARSETGAARAAVTDEIARRTPLGRRATPDETAAAICFLASPASDFITGQVISVNGGLDMVD